MKTPKQITKQQYSCARSESGLSTPSTCTVGGEGSKDRVRRDRDCLCSTRYHYGILTQMPVSMTMLGTIHTMMSEDAPRCPGGRQRRDNDGDGDYTLEVRVTRRYHARSLCHQPRWFHHGVTTSFRNHIPHPHSSFHNSIP